MAGEIIDYYTNHYDEQTRLTLHSLELIRTQDIILRYLPKPPARVLDVGGGTGVYSAWLAKLGYVVHMIDIVPKHVSQAVENINSQTEYPFTASIGDATALQEESDSFDAVLLMGPLYHLIELNNRIRALSESLRVLRDGGLVFAVAISRYASLFDGMIDKYLDDEEVREIVEKDLSEGIHLPNNPRYFTTAYFHHTNELIDEVQKAGFQVKETLPIEGVIWLLKDIDDRWSDEKERRQLQYVLDKTEKDPNMIEMSCHFMCIGEK